MARPTTCTIHQLGPGASQKCDVMMRQSISISISISIGIGIGHKRSRGCYVP